MPTAVEVKVYISICSFPDFASDITVPPGTYDLEEMENPTSPSNPPWFVLDIDGKKGGCTAFGWYKKQRGKTVELTLEEGEIPPYVSPIAGSYSKTVERYARLV